MAQALDVEHCRGITPSGHYCPIPSGDHMQGVVTKDGVVHWLERRVEFSGIVRFLRLVAQSRHPDINDEIPWRRVYRLCKTATEMSPTIHTRIPARYFRKDRAFVKASVASLTNDVPMRKEAFDWARREGGQTWASR
jgi:hypothetical protein